MSNDFRIDPIKLRPLQSNPYELKLNDSYKIWESNKINDIYKKYNKNIGRDNLKNSPLTAIGSAIVGGIEGYGSKDYNDTQKAVRSGVTGAMMMSGNPVLMAVSGITSGIDAIAEGVRFNNQNISKPAANQLGISDASLKWNNAINYVPGLSAIAGLMGTRINESKNIINSEKLGASYGGTLNDMNAIKTFKPGSRLAIGGNEVNSAINDFNIQANKLNQIALDKKRSDNNVLGLITTMQNQHIFNGRKVGLSLKIGGKIPELEEVRSIIQSLQSKKQEIQEPQKFQLGGKMNMIVTGALHARKHNLEELNPNLEGEITKKGIPVVVMNEGGEVQGQQAEVESGEIIMNFDTTKTIEDYYDEYNSTDSKTEKNKIALECGKYLVDELLKNTDDPDKLIKKTV